MSFRKPVSFLLILSLIYLISCSVKPTIRKSEIEHPKKFSESGDYELSSRWWEAFNDEHLNSLIEEALDGNFNLKTYKARLNQAIALAKMKGADRLPVLDLNSSALRKRTDTEVKTPTGETETVTGYSNSYSAGLSASYELDLWGRISSTARAYKLDSLAAKQNYRTAAITLSAEMTNSYFSLVETKKQLDLIDEQIKTSSNYLKLIKKRVENGMVRATDLLQQKQQLESLREQKSNLISKYETLKHQIALFAGKSFDRKMVSSVKDFPDIPEMPDTGIPSEVIRKRPDVKSAMLRLKASDERIEAAIANRFPRINLTAAVESGAGTVDTLFQNWVSNLTGSILMPLFDAGKRSAEVERSRAVAKEKLNSYGQTVLKALKEIEDALVREKNRSEQSERIDNQVELSKNVLQQMKIRYLNGSIDYLKVLDALRSYQGLQKKQITADLNHLKARVGLYRSLAGGWKIEDNIEESDNEQ